MAGVPPQFAAHQFKKKGQLSGAAEERGEVPGAPDPDDVVKKRGRGNKGLAALLARRRALSNNQPVAGRGTPIGAHRAMRAAAQQRGTPGSPY